MKVLNEIEGMLKDKFAELDSTAFFNQKKVLDAFKECQVSVRHFTPTTGYGYGDVGRENLARLYAKIFGGEDALVSPLFTSGTHTITTMLFGLLRPNDVMLTITGRPYDTLHDTIWGTNNGSLKEFGVKYEELSLKNGEIDIDLVLQKVKELKPKVIHLQRSRGYAWRKPISIDEIEKVVKKIRSVYKGGFITVDNCYGEFVEEREPTEVGVDVIVGSLIKNPGGGIASTGGYIVGTKEAIELISYRHTSPSLGTEVGSYIGGYRLMYQGIFLAPHVVKEALKGAYLVGEVMKQKGYKILPDSNEKSYDIIKSIEFNTAEELIAFVQKVQDISPVDSFAKPMPWDMPGYEDKVIMAAGSFVDGASIELSCDSPIKKPYIAYFQGGLTYEHIKVLAEDLTKWGF